MHSHLPLVLYTLATQIYSKLLRIDLSLGHMQAMWNQIMFHLIS